MKHSEKLKKLVVCALMIAVANVLSFIKIDMPMGGGLTICSMVPIIFTAVMYGPSWGITTAFIYSVFQLLFGLDNVAYADSVGIAVLIVLFDYIVAYTVIGLAGFFKDTKRSPVKVAIASASVLVLRFVCHFITGWFVWDALWPNEFGLSSAVYSLCYNGIYMLPEIVISSAVCALLCSSKQTRELLVKENSTDSKSSVGSGKLLLIGGIIFIAIQIAAYIGLFLTKELDFFTDMSSAKAVFSQILYAVSCNLVGIIGIIFTVCGIATTAKKKD